MIEIGSIINENIEIIIGITIWIIGFYVLFKYLW